MRPTPPGLWLVFHQLAVIVLLLVAACAGTEPVPDGFIDRIEGDWAVVVVEDGGHFRETLVPIDALPAGATEGDTLREGRLDPAAREALRARIEALQRHLRRPPPPSSAESATASP